jgi:hypothetical protein
MLVSRSKNYLTRYVRLVKLMECVVLIVLQYIKDWKPRFQTNQLVKGKITGYVAFENPDHAFLT